MRPFSEFVGKLQEAGGPPTPTAEYMHKMIVDRLKEFKLDKSIRGLISKMPKAGSPEWDKAFSKGTMISLVKNVPFTDKDLGVPAFLYRNFTMDIQVGADENAAVIRIDTHFEYQAGGSNGTTYIDYFHPEKNDWSR